MSVASRRAVDDSDGLRQACSRGDLAGAHAALDRLDAGGLIVNDVPTFRIDYVPCGGVRIRRCSLAHRDTAELKRLAISRRM